MPNQRWLRNRPTRSLARAVLVLAAVGLLPHCTDRSREVTAPLHPPAPSAAAPSAEPAAAALARACRAGRLASGALWQVCLPDRWLGSLVVYAPGYLSPYDAVRLRDDELGGTSVQELATGLGYVFATTSYHKGGLVLPQATSDLIELVGIANGIVSEATGGQTSRHVYLVGPSLGGLVTAKSVEAAPHVFSGGLAACGPYGRFRSQLAYVGDFRVVFDHLFAARVPGWPVWSQNRAAGDPGLVDEAFRAAWSDTFEPRVRAALLQSPGRAAELIRVSRAPIDGGDVARSTVQTVTGVLWYHLFGTNDALHVLHGQPFNNRSRFYFGSGNDLRLNLQVQRFVDTGDALARVASTFETSGRLARPLVTLHTTGDEIVPHWHQRLYAGKASPWYRHTPIAVARYGHCNFTREEVLVAFAVLVLRVSGQNLTVAQRVLPDPGAQARFLRLAREQGARPSIAPPERLPSR